MALQAEGCPLPSPLLPSQRGSLPTRAVADSPWQTAEGERVKLNTFIRGYCARHANDAWLVDLGEDRGVGGCEQRMGDHSGRVCVGWEGVVH